MHHCLASQYDLLQGRLAKAHKANDKVVAEVYGIDTDMSEEDIALELMRRSEKMAKAKEKKKKKRKVLQKKETPKKIQNRPDMEEFPFAEQDDSLEKG